MLDFYKTEDTKLRLSYPFGNPDGARTNISTMMDGLISAVPSSVAAKVTSGDFISTRVIIGAKGSGKTHYLRLLRARVSDNPSVVSHRWEQENPATDLVVHFSQTYPRQLISEKWASLWKCSLYIYISTNILYNSKLREYIIEESKDIEEFLKYFKVIPSSAKECRTKTKHPWKLAGYINFLINSHCSTQKQMDDFLRDSKWNDFFSIIEEIIRKLPPLYFYIDSVDEEYERAPAYWDRCQRGLFYAVMHLLREEELGEKLHIVICLRDNVFSSIIRSEHSTKFIKEAHLLRLNWNKESIASFFHKKIELLDSVLLVNKSSPKDIKNWIGIDVIYNPVRDIYENFESYFLRHTRYVPRDVVMMGNEICDLIVTNDRNKENFESQLRETIAGCAKIIGGELLTICAKQISIDTMPDTAGRYDYTSGYTSVDEYHEGNYIILKTILSQINTDKMKYEMICKIEEEGKMHFGVNCSLTSILWKNGIIGYKMNGNKMHTYIFYSFGKEADNILPPNKELYVFNSCLIDCLELTPYDNIPVY